MARVVHWNGRSIPPEMRKLPAGDYIVAEYHSHKLTPTEEEGIRQAIASLDRGEGVPGAQVHTRLTKIIEKHRRAKSRRKAKAPSR